MAGTALVKGHVEIRVNTKPETIELDEEAAKSHTPPGWPLKMIEITPRDKAPKKFGDGVYRFGAALTLSVILPRRGWSLLKQSSRYAYLRPPPGQRVPPFQISIAVPTDEESLAIAKRCFERGQSWIGQLGEWPTWYIHERNTDMIESWRDQETGLPRSRLHSSPPESRLTIGEWGVWKMEVTGVGGRFWIGAVPPVDVSTDTLSPLTEGELLQVELNIYERNAEARRLCIEHYGPTCQACDLNYEDKYGEIGRGLIHVHHITPLSDIGEQYLVDPLRDLVPLCASCHQVIHSRIPPYSVEEVRAAVKSQPNLSGLK